MEKSNLQEYFKTRDESHLTFIEGKQPDRFECKRLKPRQIANIKDRAMNQDGSYKWNLLAMMAFAEGCHLVNVSDGSQVLRGTMKEDEWVEHIANKFSFLTVIEIGKAVLDLSEMSTEKLGPFIY